MRTEMTTTAEEALSHERQTGWWLVRSFDGQTSIITGGVLIYYVTFLTAVKVLCDRILWFSKCQNLHHWFFLNSWDTKPFFSFKIWEEKFCIIVQSEFFFFSNLIKSDNWSGCKTFVCCVNMKTELNLPLQTFIARSYSIRSKFNIRYFKKVFCIIVRLTICSCWTISSL